MTPRHNTEYALERLAGQMGFLGPHARLLLGEAIVAMKAQQYASVIILAAAVFDVALREGDIRADGVTIASVRDSRDAFWLRDRRNGIVHYEGGKGGLMGETGASDILRVDAVRACAILAEALEGIA